MRKFLLILLAAGVGQAHFTLVQPASSIAIDDGGKGAPPCGEGPPSNIVTQAQGGHPIPIQLSEFIFHPGHYRIALSVNSRAELPPDPAVVVNSFGDSVSASIQTPVQAPVLADGLFAHTTPPTGDFRTSITLPNLNCEKCTLQIIEFMAEHGPNPGGGYFYHHCADLRITADPALPPADSSWPRAAVQNRAVIPHILAGGGWSTVLSLVNPSAVPMPVTVALRGDNGAPMNLPGAGPLDTIVNPNATALISIGDPEASGVTGWAEVRSAGPLGGYAMARSVTAESMVPLQARLPSSVTLPFDNTAGSVTNLAIANPSSSPTTILIASWDQNGNEAGTQTVAIAAGGHMEVVLPTQIPATAGKRGIVRLEGPAGFAALALRLTQSGDFQSLPTMP